MHTAQRLRPFFGFSITVALALCATRLVPAELSAGPTARLSQDGLEQRFEWASAWTAAHAGYALGNTHGGIVIDASGAIYVNTDSERAVVVFSPAGQVLRSFGKELAGGLHGMAIAREGEQEFLYLTHIGSGEVLKTTLQGEILWRVGVPLESGLYPEGQGYHPTAIALAPDGGFFVADGYGKSYIHRYDAGHKYVKSFGGPGTDVGQLQTPHGLWLDTRKGAARLLVADRENHRLQYFDLDGKPLGEVKADLRRPCGAHQLGSELAVADLCGRVTILGADDQVLAQLGDNPDTSQWANNGVPSSAWREGVFIAPHSVCFDAQGNLYVMDWVSEGRVSKLVRQH